MQPLSPILYFRRNKRRFFASVTSIVTAICFLYIMESFVHSIMQSVLATDGAYLQVAMDVFPSSTVPQVPAKTIRDLENNPHIDRLIPVSEQTISFNIPGTSNGISVYGVSNSDRAYFLSKFGIHVLQGRLPQNGRNEIAVDERIALNNHLHVGSHVGSDLDKTQDLQGNYTVVGILRGNSSLSLMGSPYPEQQQADRAAQLANGFLVFPKSGQMAKAEKAVQPLIRQNLIAWTPSRAAAEFEATTQSVNILDGFAVLSIFVMVVCLVCSKYAQYFERRGEFGVLNAMGYTRGDLLRRVFWEITITNLFSFALGMVFAVVLCRIVTYNAFERIGGVGIYLYGKAAVVALLAPLFTTLFTLIPVFRLIGRVDAISIIEKN
ncbi:ABC transporter permease [Ethanoligenens harbinense]|uniref:ABC3 transporter permease C-terminal domain-containing protein n=1 Tax=Ethanoligenens harbinense (strain DSM 18485 / JCM 12961 / CGMCC 1.5033 / YUAN-3) TaxID=663278 RepID=E6U4Y0_ETHHY|nr:FtsX-like permease family protein [Ethanoligenens harbinense]ADU26686.1 protein of unknown function DUF214 [Ethanoligenens harbinense YUAN-3]AVQ95803.1 hypothetical protein CXQ68_05865 [Ethanoligenens harbinense YUAN-3]AYF38464.1 hypothetical protein CXP51_05725 [Ethanoligenens harbinense]AYF41210.1 hypothetical protein CN246_05865 [Ethanoligenens harbinense]QCN92043.1 hypothetical protein DRA42_05885 [Ethanoligenens harbinense]